LNIIVSNQSGVARGIFTEAQYRAVQRELLRQIEGEGDSLVDASYFCADAPGAASARRKPAPGMLLEAAADFGIDLARSVIVGDKSSDIECARRVGARSILVATGYGSTQACEPDYRASGSTAATEWILRHLIT
jgi:D-glycero-D-manno-heptose 1,7-bisphosphate phosphatase